MTFLTKFAACGGIAPPVAKSQRKVVGEPGPLPEIAMNASTKSRQSRALAPFSEPCDEALSHKTSIARTIVNLLLFVHLFSVGLLMVFNGSAILPGDTAAKMLQPKLRRVPGYYLQLLGMDFDFDSGQRFPADAWVRMQADEAARHLKSAEETTDPAVRKQNLAAAQGHLRLLDPPRLGDPRLTHRGLFHLTYADELDVGHFLQFRFEQDGLEQFIRLPADDMSGQRRIRYEMLAREAARLARADRAKDVVPGAEQTRDILPTAVAGHLMDNVGTSSGEISIVRRGIQEQVHLLTPERAMQEEAWRSDPWHANWLTSAFQRKAQKSSGGRVLFINPNEDKLSAPAPEEEKK